MKNQTPGSTAADKVPHRLSPGLADAFVSRIRFPSRIAEPQMHLASRGRASLRRTMVPPIAGIKAVLAPVGSHSFLSQIAADSPSSVGSGRTRAHPLPSALSALCGAECTL